MDLSFARNSEDNNDSDSDNEDRVPAPRRNKFTYRSPPDFQNPLAHSSQAGPAPPVNLWYPRASQPAEENQPASYDRYANYQGSGTPESCSQGKFSTAT